MLPEVLGKEFYATKKYPAPIKVHDFGPKQLQEQLNNAAQSTSFLQGNGPNYSLQVGKTTQKANDVALNVQQALAQSLAHLTCFESERIGFSDISQVTLKIEGSPELPIFNQLSEQDIKAFKSAL